MSDRSEPRGAATAAERDELMDLLAVKINEAEQQGYRSFRLPPLSVAEGHRIMRALLPAERDREATTLAERRPEMEYVATEIAPALSAVLDAYLDVEHARVPDGYRQAWEALQERRTALLHRVCGLIEDAETAERQRAAALLASPAEPSREAVQGVAFLLVRDGCVLMERCPKKAARHGGEWFIPGGRIEARETEGAALQRELREELGVRNCSARPLPLVDATGGDAWGPFLMRPYLVQEWDGDLPDHCLDHPDVPLRWVPLAEAAGSPTPAVRAMIAMLPAALRATPATPGAREVSKVPAAERLWDAINEAAEESGSIPFGDSVSVVVGDLINVLWRLDAARAVPARACGRDAHDYVACYRCGHDCGMDAVVSSEVWAQISPTGDEGGMLCAWCMDDLCAERGIPGPVPVRLYFAGKVLAAVLPEDELGGEGDAATPGAQTPDETPENALARALLSFHAQMDRWELDSDILPQPDPWKFAAEWLPVIREAGAQTPDALRKYDDHERPFSHCYDCRLPYTDPGFEDLIVPDEVWERINPTHHKGAGLLCPTCIVRRCNVLGLGFARIPAVWASGPFHVEAYHPAEAGAQAPDEAPKFWSENRPTPNETPRDWAEDFGHENGQYINYCIQCGESFIGRKRRKWCKRCAAEAGAQTEPREGEG